MGTPTDLTCEACGVQFDLTPEYLARYGGQTTHCACGHAMVISPPRANDAPILSYRAPAVRTKASGGIWRSRSALVIERGVRLPQRCAECGEPVPRTFRISRLKPSLGGSFTLAGKLVSGTMTQPVGIRFGYCARHARWIMPRTAMWIRLTCVILVMPLAIAALFAHEKHSVMFYPVTGLAIGALILPFVIMFREPPVNVAAMDRDHAWLLGFGEDYLRPFPSLEEEVDRDTAEVATKLDELAPP